MAEVESEELGWIIDDTEDTEGVEGVDDVEVDSEKTTPHTKDDRSHFREQMQVARSAGTLERVTLRLPQQDKNELTFWSAAQDLSMSEYVLRAVVNQISRDNGRVDNETLITGRMNQMIELIVGMESRVTNLEQIMTQFMDMFSTLISGDTVLTDEDDGVL